MNLELHIKIIGVLFIILACIHLWFPRYFKWKEELFKLSLVNSEMMKWHTFFIALAVFLMGLLCVSSAAELVSTSLGKKLLTGMGVFWTLRLIIQFFGYSGTLWKGKKFETTIHITFSALWIYVSGVFWLGVFT